MTIKKLVYISLISALLFFSVSLFTILNYLEMTNEEWSSIKYKIKIGFPFSYYELFWLDCISPNRGWYVKNLVYDVFIFWFITFIGFLMVMRIKEKRGKWKCCTRASSTTKQ